jgi:predicted enzyme related to lactoylglutathione lyase
MSPTFRSGKICYIEIPAIDIARSAEFYRRVFGWNVRTRDDGTSGFDDGVNEVSGSWVLGRPPATDPGLMVHIMVGDAAAACELVKSLGGEIVQPIDPDSKEVFAHFRDPAGNILGIYEHRGI